MVTTILKWGVEIESSIREDVGVMVASLTEVVEKGTTAIKVVIKGCCCW